MMSASAACACVLALNCLQNSMMFTPCWPSAGPMGGAGLALPAGTWSLMYPVTFFIAKRLREGAALEAVRSVGRGGSRQGPAFMDPRGEKRKEKTYEGGQLPEKNGPSTPGPLCVPFA